MEEYLVHRGFSPRQVEQQVGYLNRKKGTKTELRGWLMPKPLYDMHWWDFANQEEKFFIDAYNFVLNFDRKSLQQSMGELGKRLEADVINRT